MTMELFFESRWAFAFPDVGLLTVEILSERIPIR